MTVLEGPVPSASILNKRLVASAYFKDSYSAAISDAHAPPTALFHKLFDHHPWWVKALLISRNKIAAWCGLQVAPAATILKADTKDHYAVGDTIGPWPIFALTDNEVIAGRDNPHLDFRLSVLRQMVGDEPRVFVSTICSVNHWSGKLYLFFIIPFHRWGVRKLMANAIAAGRI
jgi:hypothetical protein